MKRFILLSIFFFISNPAFGQWHKIYDFKFSGHGVQDSVSDLIECVYFINLPGPPRIGFAGTVYNFWKTTDGGGSWKNVNINGEMEGVTDVCFKDSLTGWCVIPGEVFKTTDGGESWFSQFITNYPTNCIHYCSSSNKLFIDKGDTMYVSSDLGSTWKPGFDAFIVYFSFSSDLTGIASAGLNDDTGENVILRTSDAGNTWARSDSTFPALFGCDEPLAIWGTPTCFATSNNRIKVLRSDDYGATWKQLIDFGPNADTFGDEIGPVGSGYIRGNLSRLYLQSDSGMFVSTDSGVTWFNDGGPPYGGGGGAGKFYADKGRTMAGWWNTGGTLVSSGGLWEEIWPTAGVAESGVTNSNNALSVFPNPASSNLQIMGGQPGEVHLFDLMGRERMSATMDGANTTLDVSSLPPGLYFVSDGRSEVKFVKE